MYAALASLIIALMAAAVPLGPYIVFNSEIGDELSHEIPLVDVFFPGTSYAYDTKLGDFFIIIWSIYAVLFAVSLLGPKTNVVKIILNAVSNGKIPSNENYTSVVVKWFSILVLLSAIVIILQDAVGISTEPPDAGNELVQFVTIAAAPLIEETAFRILLVGLPLFLIYSYRSSIRHFFKSLWQPGINLQPGDYVKAVWIVVGTGILFGLAHIMLGEPWTPGKFLQASIGGIIIGWVYLKHGLLPAIMVHWATNYFIFSYVYFVADVSNASTESALHHPLIGTLEILFLATGVLSVMSMLVTRYCKPKLEIE